MARHPIDLLTAQILQHAVARSHEEDLRLWARGAWQVDPDTVIRPDLLALDGLADVGPPLDRPPLFAVFVARGEVQRAWLVDEVGACLGPDLDRAILVDQDAGVFQERLGAGPARELKKLAGVLNDRLERRLLEPAAFDGLLELRADREDERWHVAPDFAAHVVEAPLRLWEALLLRGHRFTQELLDGEIPLVAELSGEAAADAMLRACREDAERLVGAAAVDEGGWCVAGPVRLRRQGAHVELRVTPGPADRHSALTPREAPAPGQALPTLAGALLAGGEGGRLELLQGSTWTTLRCRAPEEAETLAKDLGRRVDAWCRAPVRVMSGDLSPDPEQREWRVTVRDEWLRLHVPLARDHLLPWQVLSGRMWRRA
jgi:hypothetical protein